MKELNPDIYENVVIGNFLFGLGAAMQFRHRDREMPLASINLLQQTRLDESFADVLIRTPGTIRLLEFKREANKSLKETTKLWMLKKGLRSTPERMARLREVSREMHWYIETSNRASCPANRSKKLELQSKALEEPNFKVRIVPYLDFKRPGGYTDLADFVKVTADQASGHPCEDVEDHVEYLRLLSWSRGSTLTGSLLVSISVTGEPRYIAVNDFQDIFFTREAVLERVHQIQHEMRVAHKHEMRLAHEHKIEPNLERRIGMGMGR